MRNTIPIVFFAAIVGWTALQTMGELRQSKVICSLPISLDKGEHFNSGTLISGHFIFTALKYEIDVKSVRSIVIRFVGLQEDKDKTVKRGNFDMRRAGAVIYIKICVHKIFNTYALKFMIIKHHQSNIADVQYRQYDCYVKGHHGEVLVSELVLFSDISSSIKKYEQGEDITLQFRTSDLLERSAIGGAVVERESSEVLGIITIVYIGTYHHRQVSIITVQTLRVISSIFVTSTTFCNPLDILNPF